MGHMIGVPGQNLILACRNGICHNLVGHEFVTPAMCPAFPNECARPSKGLGSDPVASDR